LTSGPTGTFQRAPGTPVLPPTPVRFVLHFAWGRYRTWILAMVTTEMGNATCGILIPYALNRIITSVTQSQSAPGAVFTSLRGPLLLFVGLSLGELVLGRATTSIQFRLGPRLRQEVARSLYHYLQYHSHRFLSESFAGALAHRISEASQGVSQTLWTLITEFWPIAIVITVANGLLLSANRWLGLFAAAWSVSFISVSFVLARRCQPYALAAAAGRSETTGHIVDSVTNLASARLFARLDFERELLDRAQERELVAVMRSNLRMERVRWFQFGAAAALKVGMVVVALHLWSRGAIGVGQFVMALSLSLLIIAEVRNLSRRFLEFFEFVGNVANGVRSIVRPHDLVDAADARSAGDAPIAGGAIEFRDVEFRYGDGKQVFAGLSVVIDPGQRVGLVGLSGSGKSTFVSLLLRLYDPQAGSILVGGHDLRALTQEALHAQVSVIPQDPTLFHRSLHENILYGRLDASAAEIEAAVARAHASEFIAQIPGGYEALVGERGVKLSGGQRQRIAIARVILKDAPVLILDEATSSLDSITERAIQDTLDRVMAGKTVVVVAHRLSTIAHLDRILVFDRGCVVEDGSHADLLARRGAYYRLWSQQSDGFLPRGGETAAHGAAIGSEAHHQPAALDLDERVRRGVLEHQGDTAGEHPQTDADADAAPDLEAAIGGELVHAHGAVVREAPMSPHAHQEGTEAHARSADGGHHAAPGVGGGAAGFDVDEHVPALTLELEAR
jgi:ATP-binding cassette, subfamily B, bacterial